MAPPRSSCLGACALLLAVAGGCFSPTWEARLAGADAAAELDAGPPEACLIDGAAWSYGDLNPENPCQRCEPAKSDSVWTNLVSGTACPDDGLPCTTDRCSGTGLCEHKPSGRQIPCNGRCCAVGQACVNGQCSDVDPCDGACTGATPVCDAASHKCLCDSNPDSCGGGPLRCIDGICLPGECAPACAGETPDCVNGACRCNATSCRAGSTCDPAAGACVGSMFCWPLDPGACPPGQGCYWIDTTFVHECRPAGTTPTGEPCQVEPDCQPGNACWLDPTGAHMICSRYCDPSAPAACGAGQTCQPFGDGTGYCATGSAQWCSVLDPSSCPAGFGCYPTSNGGAACLGAGTLPAGASCAQAPDCVPGAFCWNSVCVKACNPFVTPTGCAAPAESCVAIAGRGYGFCEPCPAAQVCGPNCCSLGQTCNPATLSCESR